MIKKNLLVLIIFLMFLDFTKSQNNYLHINYSLVHNGKNIEFLYRIDGAKNSFSFGIKYHLNPKTAFFNNSLYLRNTAFAKSFFEGVGIVGVYYRRIKVPKELVTPYFFYNAQLSRLHLKTLSYYPLNFKGTTAYSKNYQEFLPTTFFEQNIGLHLDLQIFDSLHLTLSGGGGITLINDSDPKILKSPNDNLFGLGEWEFSSILSVGVNYKIRR